ncbi:MAG: DUF2007 domain-containing protein [Flavobacteriales bacterium]|nr:DUF2007 domain-containing protein [Flavobacteriales bacterium]
MNLVNLKTFTNSAQANIYKSMLEANGIKAFLFDEMTSLTNAEINFSSGGVRLMVNQEDVEKALEFINNR